MEVHVNIYDRVRSKKEDVRERYSRRKSVKLHAE